MSRTGFRFFNFKRHAVELVIEPWADVEVVEAGGRIDFTLEGDNAEIEFSWDEKDPLVFLWADTITMASRRRKKVWDLPPDYRGNPPFARWHGDPPSWGPLPDPHSDD